MRSINVSLSEDAHARLSRLKLGLGCHNLGEVLEHILLCASLDGVTATYHDLPPSVENHESRSARDKRQPEK
jgi:hypothetical protein